MAFFSVFMRLTALAVCLLPGLAHAQNTAADMPIADLHFHAERGDEPAEFKSMFEKSGVKWMGSGERLGCPSVLAKYKSYYGKQYIAFGGQSSMNDISSSSREMENPNNPKFIELLAYLEKGLADKTFAGIGELFVNNLYSNPFPHMRRKMNITGPVITQLFELAAKYDAFVTFHMEGSADSVEHLEKLAASNRKGRIILNHCGVNIPPAGMDYLFTNHPNLFCEIAIRYPPLWPPNTVYTRIFDSGSITAGWKDVIIKHADRFMIGTDGTGGGSSYTLSISNVRNGLLANLPIEVARKVAYENAVALFNLE